jgi:hypothetical protein
MDDPLGLPPALALDELGNARGRTERQQRKSSSFPFQSWPGGRASHDSTLARGYDQSPILRSYCAPGSCFSCGS